MSLIVVGSEFDGTSQFLPRSIAIFHFQVRLCELVVSLDEAVVDFKGVGILDFRLAVLSLGKIFFAALKVLLFSHVGITRAAEGDDEKSASQQETES